MNSSELKARFSAYQQATATFEANNVQAMLSDLFASDVVLHMCHPFGDMQGPDAYFKNCIGALHSSMPDLERRDMIVMAGDH